MTIETLPFEHRPRNSIANNLDKINELVDWTNLDTHLYSSATGERVTVDDASSVKGLMVDGRSVQDGTPTPDAPVPVQVVGGKNLLPLTAQTVTNRGVTATVDNTGTVTITGTATGGNAALTIPVASNVPLANNVDYTAQRITVSGSFDGTFYVRGIDDTNQTIHHLFNLASVTERTAKFTNNAIIQAVYIVISENTTIDCVLHVQVEQGSTATDYVPYGNIALVIDGTPTDINLQGNKLASLPDGTRDELHIDSAGRVWIEKRVKRLTYNGDTLPTLNNSSATLENWVIAASTVNDWKYAPNRYPNNLSSRNTITNSYPIAELGFASATGEGISIWADGIYLRTAKDKFADGAALQAALQAHPVEVWYQLATPQTIDLGYIDTPAIPSGSVVTVSASLTPTFHLEWWVDNGITELVNDLIAYIDYKTEG